MTKVTPETTGIWEELASVLGQDPRKFLCGCNPVQGPGPRYIRSTLTESNFRSNKEAQQKHSDFNGCCPNMPLMLYV